MGTHLGKSWVYIEPTKVFIPDKGYLNAVLPITDVNAKTDFSYLSADGTQDGAFLHIA